MKVKGAGRKTYFSQVTVTIPELKLGGFVAASGTKNQFDEPPRVGDSNACPPPFLPVMFDEKINNGGSHATATHWIVRFLKSEVAQLIFLGIHRQNRIPKYYGQWT
ncbi:hypothetical protein M1146_05395 [Patescibacteria group bacterium]|nr:hypothetical protein [Patescibacteria group bacterium]